MSRRSSMLVGVDAVATLISFVGLVFLTPAWIDLGFAKEVFSLGVSVISIIFAVFIASLATIVSASDNDFIRFLEEENLFSDILFGFRITLLALFSALLVGIALFAFAAAEAVNGHKYQSRIGILCFSLFFSYALFSTLSSSFAAIGFAQRRAKFLGLNSKPR